MQLYEVKNEGELEQLNLSPENEDYGRFDEAQAINVARVIKNIESDIDAIDEEIKRLKKRMQVKQNRVESLKDYVVYMMQSNEVNKIKSPLFDLSLRKNPGKLVIYAKDQVPKDYHKEKVVQYIDEAAIKSNLLVGEVIPGCELKSGYSLRIHTANLTTTNNNEELQ